VTEYFFPVTTSTASAERPSLRSTVPPADEAGGVKDTWTDALAD
jgi:hypothetical protein